MAYFRRMGARLRLISQNEHLMWTGYKTIAVATACAGTYQDGRRGLHRYREGYPDYRLVNTEEEAIWIGCRSGFTDNVIMGATWPLTVAAIAGEASRLP